MPNDTYVRSYTYDEDRIDNENKIKELNARALLDVLEQRSHGLSNIAFLHYKDEA
jgi:hypothetical protein